MSVKIYDLLIIGGGINGAGIARDAAGRGLSVLLCEQHDLAQHTSSASTKLIHGGLRYLEYYEFRLVRKALQEREVLIRNAPHIIWPLRFIMPYQSHLRPKWMIRAGLYLYDHLAKRTLLPASNNVDLQQHPAGQVLKHEFKTGFEYSDGWVYDARLVVLNAMDAQARGADVRTRTAVVECQRFQSHWQVVLQTDSGAQETVQAKALVNAAGPWAVSVLKDIVRVAPRHHLRHVKGSHIIVKSLFKHPYAYIFQHTDNRIIFAIPYEGDFTLIGTTDVEYHDDPAQVEISPSEVDYLCEVINSYFKTRISSIDVVSSYAGVRPLLEDEHGNPAAVTRDYLLELNADGGAPVLSVLGGKITTYRRLAEDALEKLGETLDFPDAKWTASAYLPGGDIKNADFESFLTAQASQYPWLPAPLLQHYARHYGTRMSVLLGEKTSLSDLGQELTPQLFAAEVDYLIQYEWARTAQDVLWRRTKLGLLATSEDVERLSEYLSRNEQLLYHDSIFQTEGQQ